MLSVFLKRSSQAVRSFCTSRPRKVHHFEDVGGEPYENLPFKYRGRLRMTVMHTIFWTTAAWAPFLVVRYQLWKKNKK